MTNTSRVDAPLDLHFRHRLRFTEDAFAPGNPVLPEVLDPGDRPTARVLVFVDEHVAESRRELCGRIEAFFAAHAPRLALAARPCLVPGGEVCKNDLSELQKLLAAIHGAHLCRHSYVMAVGGGAVLDAVGFAAAIAHRGIRLVRLPTTTLAQCDSGVGVKNGINAFGKKNYLGVFTPPWAVVNDEELLSTLSERDWRSGFAEAVKVALIKDAGFFDRIARDAARIRRRDPAASIPVLRRSAVVHLDHIVFGGDPFEATTARPLDFGHWAAHKLEQMTRFRLRHGEAVALGLALDVAYSALALGLSWAEVERIHRCLADLGFALYDEAMADTDALLQGLEEFREHLGGELTVTLLNGIGRPIEVHQVNRRHLLDALDLLATRATGRLARPVSTLALQEAAADD